MIWAKLKEGYTKFMSSLEDALRGAQSKSARRRQVDLIYEINMAIVDALIAEIKRLNKAGQTKEAGTLITIAQSVLTNTKAYKKLIEELMKESGGD